MIKRLRPALLLAAILIVVTVLIRQDPVHLDTSVIIGVYALMALSLGMSWGLGGVLSLAQAAFATIGAYSAAIVTVTAGGSWIGGLAGALAIPPLIAYPMARLTIRLTPLALAIATLAFGEVLYMVLREGGDLTGGYIGLSGVPFLPFAQTPLAFHIVVWAVVVVVVAAYCNLKNSLWGTALTTISHDHLRARADGVAVEHSVAALFALAASIAGLAGWFYAHYVSYIAPESLATTLSISVVLMTFIGGAGHVLGPVVGAVLLTLVQDNLSTAPEAHGLLYGALVVLIILVAPSGLLGIRLRRKAPRAHEMAGAR